MASSANVKLGIRGVDATAGAFKGARSQIIKTQKQAVMSTGAMRQAQFAMGKQMKRNRRVVQQAGMQISDFAVQVGGGQSAILAFTQNAPQFIQQFGALGGALAAFVTIGGVAALMMSRAKVSVDDFADSFGALSGPIRVVGKGLHAAKEALFDFVNFTVNNLDLLLSTLMVLSALLLGRWLISLKLGSAALVWFTTTARAAAWSVAIIGWKATGATIAMSLLNGALVVFRSILITLGIPALIIGLGYLIERFLTLRKGAGSFGEAMILVGNVISEVMDRAAFAALALGETFKGVFFSISAFAAEQLDNLNESIFKFVKNSMSALAQFAGWLDPDKSAADFLATVNATTRETITLGDAANRAAAAFALANSHMAAAHAPMQSWKDLIDAINKGDMGDKFDIRDIFGGADDDDGSSVDAIKKAYADLATSISKSMGDAFMSMVEGTKSVAEGFRDMARDIIKQLYDVLVVQRLVGAVSTKDTAGTGLAGWLEGGLKGLNLFGTRAGGGPVSSGKPYLVGERGPEIMIPNTSGRVSPNGAGGGGVTVHNSYTFQGGVTQADLGNALPRLVEATKRAMVDEVQRGGAIASVMRG